MLLDSLGCHGSITRESRAALGLSVSQIGNYPISPKKTVRLNLLHTVGAQVDLKDKAYQAFFEKVSKGLPYHRDIFLCAPEIWRSLSQFPVNAVNHVFIVSDARLLVPNFSSSILQSLIHNIFSPLNIRIDQMRTQAEWFREKQINVSFIISHLHWIDDASKKFLEKSFNKMEIPYFFISKTCISSEDEECRDDVCGRPYSDTSLNQIGELMRSLHPE